MVWSSALQGQGASAPESGPYHSDKPVNRRVEQHPRMAATYAGRGLLTFSSGQPGARQGQASRACRRNGLYKNNGVRIAMLVALRGVMGTWDGDEAVEGMHGSLRLISACLLV